MLKKRDILFVSSWFPNALAPTLGNFVERHAEAISTLHRVFVVHPVPDPSRLKPKFEYRRHGDLHIGILYHPPLRPHRWYRSFFFNFAYRRMRDKLAFSPDLVHLNVLHPMGRAAVDTADRLNVPLVATEHWTGYHPNTHNYLNEHQWQGLRAVASRCQLMCPVSAHLQAAMEKRGLAGEYKIIGNVVDTDLFCLPENERPKKRLLHVSNLLDVHKNVSGILRAFHSALAADSDLHLTVIGDGDLRPHQEMAKALGLTAEKLTFQGTTSIEGIAAAMREASALVLFSNYENLPCVIGEAFASGLPVISTDVGGISEHLNSERGMLIAKGDEAALTKAMLASGNDLTPYAASDLRHYAVRHFSRAAIATAYDEVYRLALTNREP